MSTSCTHPSCDCIRLFSGADYISGRQFDVVICRRCGLTLTHPQPDFSDLAAYYPASYYGNSNRNRFPLAVEWLQSALYRHRAMKVAKLSRVKMGRVLDVGCGRGRLLDSFRRLGWEVQGTELTAEASAHARDVLGLSVTVGSLENLKLAGGRYHAITIWHVLEHVSDPQSLLTEVHRLLAPGGVLFVGVPNFGGWEARLCRDKWFHLDVPRHLMHFTQASLKHLLEKAGFTVRSWSGLAPEYDSFSLIQSLENYLGLKHNLLYSLLRRQGAKPLSKDHFSCWQIVAALALIMPLGVLSAPVTLVLGLLMKGGTLSVLATKSAD